MKVVSLVPSWTETLISAGVEVVGRTRYCLHPSEKVAAITVVGGTKKVDWDKIRSLAPDLVLLDREENTREMADDCPLPWFATHVQSMKDLPRELRALAERMQNQKLSAMAERWERVISSRPPPFPLEQPPGFLKWVTPPPAEAAPVVYTIWAKPWMAAGPNTFIGSVLDWCGWPLWGDEKYPQFDPAKDNFGKSAAGKNGSVIFLCSTEPFPFEKKPETMAKLPGAVALVDGEKLSWFGVRSLVYLESVL